MRIIILLLLMSLIRNFYKLINMLAEIKILYLSMDIISVILEIS